MYVVFYHLSLKFNFALSIPNLLQEMNVLLECLQCLSLPVDNRITLVIAIHLDISMVRNTRWFYVPEYMVQILMLFIVAALFFYPSKDLNLLSKNSGTVDS